jgi:hypothetical protein
MTTISLWTASTHHAAFRCGGWASVRLVDGQPSGMAGGERATTAARMAMAGLIAGLRDLPPGVDVAVQTGGSELASLTEVLAGRVQPEDDLDLWAQILTATKGRRLTLSRAVAVPDSPLAFAAAWAALAMDKAKMGGAFTSAIPKSNLAKALTR